MKDILLNITEVLWSLWNNHTYRLWKRRAHLLKEPRRMGYIPSSSLRAAVFFLLDFHNYIEQRIFIVIKIHESFCLRFPPTLEIPWVGHLIFVILLKFWPFRLLPKFILCSAWSILSLLYNESPNLHTNQFQRSEVMCSGVSQQWPHSMKEIFFVIFTLRRHMWLWMWVIHDIVHIHGS